MQECLPGHNRVLFNVKMTNGNFSVKCIVWSSTSVSDSCTISRRPAVVVMTVPWHSALFSFCLRFTIILFPIFLSFTLVFVKDHFREICPAGHGYTYSRSDIQISLRKMEEEEMRAEENPSASPEPSPPHQAHLPHIPSHKPHIPSYPQAPANPQVPSHEPQAPQVPTFPQVPTQPLPSRTPQIPHHPSLDPQQTGKVPSQHTPHGEWTEQQGFT